MRWLLTGRQTYWQNLPNVELEVISPKYSGSSSFEGLLCTVSVAHEMSSQLRDFKPLTRPGKKRVSIIPDFTPLTVMVDWEQEKALQLSVPHRNL